MKTDDLGVFVQNTRSMDMEPQPAEDFVMMDEISESKGLSYMPIFRADVFKKAVNYPVIVEMWDKKDFGRHQRRWLAEFTKAERNKIGKYYGRFYRWHLVTGTPLTVSCTLKTLLLLQKAVAFFGSI